MSDINPLIREESVPDDNDRALRPKSLNEFIGQSEARSNLSVFIESARRRNDAMDHTLFFGPPGLGKTTLAQIISRELGVNFRMSSGPVLAKAGDLAAIAPITLVSTLQQSDMWSPWKEYILILGFIKKRDKLKRFNS